MAAAIKLYCQNFHGTCGYKCFVMDKYHFFFPHLFFYKSIIELLSQLWCPKSKLGLWWSESQFILKKGYWKIVHTLSLTNMMMIFLWKNSIVQRKYYSSLPGIWLVFSSFAVHHVSMMYSFTSRMIQKVVCPFFIWNVDNLWRNRIIFHNLDVLLLWNSSCFSTHESWCFTWNLNFIWRLLACSCM